MLLSGKPEIYFEVERVVPTRCMTSKAGRPGSASPAAVKPERMGTMRSTRYSAQMRWMSTSCR
jgi:hypothetical protein